MILITTAAAVTYGWIEGYVINASLGNQSLLPYVLFNHFTMYQVAVGLLLGLMTGGFAIIKARNMFAKGNRYFLFSVIGNYPFSWLVEDFTYFLFNPLDALSSTHWSTWILGGVYAYSPWMPGHPKPEFFIPTWYFLVFAWFVGCQWYAHRCTIYDNLVKDEIGHQILLPIAPPTLTPGIGKKDEVAKPTDSTAIPGPIPETEPHAPTKTSVAPAPVYPSMQREGVATTTHPATSDLSPDAKAALERLRKRLKNQAPEAGG